MSDNPIANKYMLSTVDNPFSPFDQPDEWYAFDVAHGYNSCGLLARVARTSDELSDADHYQALEIAIDEIVSMHGYGMYKKVKPQDFAKK